MAYIGEDIELLAITTCTEMLSRLNQEQRMRVMAMLGSRFGNHTEPHPYYPSKLTEQTPSAVDYADKAEVVNIAVNPETTIETKITKSTKTGRSKSNKASKIESYSPVTDLNLHPEDCISLKDYYNQFSPKSNLEKNLIIVNYLTEICKLSNIGAPHVFTCYKNLGQKIPTALRQSLIDTKRRQGWINTADMDDLKTTTSGYNYLEHEMAKKEAE